MLSFRVNIELNDLKLLINKIIKYMISENVSSIIHTKSLLLTNKKNRTKDSGITSNSKLWTSNNNVCLLWNMYYEYVKARNARMCVCVHAVRLCVCSVY